MSIRSWLKCGGRGSGAGPKGFCEEHGFVSRFSDGFEGQKESSDVTISFSFQKYYSVCPFGHGLKGILKKIWEAVVVI